jgi:trans-aconitate methyltransferase
MTHLETTHRTTAYTGPRDDVTRLIGRNRFRILDLGCSTGSLGASLKRRQGAEVHGVEIDPASAEIARTRLDHVVMGSLDDWDGIAAQLPPGDYDCQAL